MNSTYDTDVLVVGAGPTGLTLAASLINRGIATTIVDAQADGRPHLACGGGQCPHPRSPRGPRRDAAVGQGGRPGAAVHHPRPEPRPDEPRLQWADDRLPVHAPDPSERHGDVVERPAARAGRIRGPFQVPDVGRAGRRRRHGDVRRRRRRPGPLRRGRRRHPQLGSRTGGHRLPRRRSTASRSSWPMSTSTARSRSRRSCCSGPRPV